MNIYAPRKLEFYEDDFPQIFPQGHMESYGDYLPFKRRVMKRPIGFMSDLDNLMEDDTR